MAVWHRLIVLFIIVGCTLLSFHHGTSLGRFLAAEDDENEACNAETNIYDVARPSSMKQRNYTSSPHRVLPPVSSQFSFNSTFQSAKLSTNSAVPSVKNNTITTYYCVVTKNSMWPGVNFGKEHWGWTRSVPHSAEAIFACWSWFQRVGANSATRALLVGDGMPMIMHKWSLQLVRAMRCRVFAYKTLRGLMPLLREKQDQASVTYFEPQFVENHWIDSRLDANSLREMILPGFERDATQIHIGILERDNNRRIRNLTELEQRLVKHDSPEQLSFNVTIQRMDDLKLHEQARWFASQHIIVAAHGAALTNVIFSFPNTTVIQLYPFRYYLPGYFESLVSKIGGHSLDWYPGDKATAPNVHTQMKPGERKQRKDAEYIDTNVTEIVDLVLEAARRHYIGTLG